MRLAPRPAWRFRDAHPRVKPVISLSTSWLSHRHTDGHTMLREVAALGFEWVELSHGIRVSLVPGVLKAVGAGVLKVSSQVPPHPDPLEWWLVRQTPEASQVSASSQSDVVALPQSAPAAK